MAVETAPRSTELSSLSRLLVYILAAVFALIGIVMFVLPGWAAANFPWRVSPFVAMTMGAWYLGNAAFAVEVARTWRWGATYACLIYLWLFSFMESLLPLLHREVLRLDAPLALPYFGMLAIATVISIVTLIDAVRTRPALAIDGPPVPWWVRGLLGLFVLAVGYLAVPLLLGRARGGTIWPGELSLLTARGFGAFYLALTLADATLLIARTIPPVVAYMRAGLALVVAITIAGLVYIGEFDFAARPGGLIYFGLYIGAAVSATFILAYNWYARKRLPARSTPQT
jgi:hypothetical protein